MHRSPLDLERARILAEEGERLDPAERDAAERALLSTYGVRRFAGPADHYLLPLQWTPFSERARLFGRERLDAIGADAAAVTHALATFERVKHADPYDQTLYAHLKVNLPLRWA